METFEPQSNPPIDLRQFKAHAMMAKAGRDPRPAERFAGSFPGAARRWGPRSNAFDSAKPFAPEIVFASSDRSMLQTLLLIFAPLLVIGLLVALALASPAGFSVLVLLGGMVLVLWTSKALGVSELPSSNLWTNIPLDKFASMFPRSLMIFAALVPLALLVGLMLANPEDKTTILFVGGMFFVLMIPTLLKHHHLALLLSWSAFVNAFFLPGQPPLWMLMTAISLFFSILAKAMNRNQVSFLTPFNVALPLVLFGLVVMVTANLTGGVGMRSVGSDVYGGKRYFFIWGAIVGFFALTARPLPAAQVKTMSALFFLTGITAIVSNLAFALGPGFYFLYFLFPAEWAVSQAYAQFNPEGAGGIMRLGGLSPACMAVVSYCLIRYGIKGILDFSKWWRAAIFAGAVFAGLFSGFRAYLVVLGLVLIIQFVLEGLHRTKWMPMSVMAGILFMAAVLPFSERLPLSAQRAISFLPVKIDPAARYDAQGSWEWRINMWETLVGEIPKYFWIGKGYAIDPMDLMLTDEAVRRGQAESYETALVAGDYHSGPLSVLLPFGIFGTLTFLWFLVAATKTLWLNYRNGNPEYFTINCFLLASMIAKLIFYFFVFGAVNSDLAIFVGLVGLSIVVNRGVRTRPHVAEEELATVAEKPVPMRQPRPQLVPA